MTITVYLSIKDFWKWYKKESRCTHAWLASVGGLKYVELTVSLEDIQETGNPELVRLKERN